MMQEKKVLIVALFSIFIDLLAFSSFWLSNDIFLDVIFPFSRLFGVLNYWLLFLYVRKRSDKLLSFVPVVLISLGALSVELLWHSFNSGFMNGGFDITNFQAFVIQILRLGIPFILSTLGEVLFGVQIRKQKDSLLKRVGGGVIIICILSFFVETFAALIDIKLPGLGSFIMLIVRVSPALLFSWFYINTISRIKLD